MLPIQAYRSSIMTLQMVLGPFHILLCHPATEGFILRQRFFGAPPATGHIFGALLEFTSNFPRRPLPPSLLAVSEIPHAGPCLRSAVNRRALRTLLFAPPAPSLPPFTHAHAPRRHPPLPCPRALHVPTRCLPRASLARALRAACTLRPVRHPPRRCPAAPSPHATSPWRRLPADHTTTASPPHPCRLPALDHICVPPHPVLLPLRRTLPACVPRVRQYTPWGTSPSALRQQLASLATTSMSPMLTPSFPCARPTARPIPPASPHPAVTSPLSLFTASIGAVHRTPSSPSLPSSSTSLPHTSSLPARCATAQPHLRCARSPVPAACSPLPRFHLASACASVLPRSFRPPTLPRCASVAPCHTLPRPYRPASALPPSRLPTPASASPHDHTAVASPEYPCRLPRLLPHPPRSSLPAALHLRLHTSAPTRSLLSHQKPRHTLGVPATPLAAVSDAREPPRPFASPTGAPWQSPPLLPYPPPTLPRWRQYLWCEDTD
ncbi:hypothetical protein B0H14DRAFT_3453271 [Mycena olivaceomarginata]|nr:hypothetical protein B0H14DRAFT_3453271 [Mycena olivaceomarginata]